MQERFGWRIRTMRVAAQKHPVDLAFELNVTRAHLEDIEHGFEDADLVLLEKIATAFGLPLERLFQEL